MRRRSRIPWSRTLAVGWSLIALAFFLAPIFVMISTSFKNQIDIADPSKVFIFPVTTSHYQKAIGDGIGSYLRNSVVAASVATTIGVVAGSMAAYALARMRFKGRRFLASWVLSTRMLPVVVGVIPLFLLLGAIHLTDTMVGLIAAHVSITLPLAIWLLLGFFGDVPEELEEAAMVDGCTRLQAFWNIALPLAAPGLVATAILCFIFSWNDLMFALVLTSSNGAQTLPVMISGFITQFGLDWGVMMASATVAAIPVFVFAFVAYRYLGRGLTLGALK